MPELPDIMFHRPWTVVNSTPARGSRNDGKPDNHLPAETGVQSAQSGKRKGVGISDGPKTPITAKRPKNTAQASAARPLASTSPRMVSPNDIITALQSSESSTISKPSALLLSGKELVAIIEATLPPQCPGLSPEEVAMKILEDRDEILEDKELDKFKSKIRLVLPSMSRDQKIYRRQVKGPNGGPAFGYFLTEEQEKSPMESETSEASTGPRSTVTPQPLPTNANTAEFTLQDKSNTQETNLQRLQEDTRPISPHNSEDPIAVESQTGRRRQQDSSDTVFATATSDASLMNLGRLVVQCQKLTTEHQKATMRLSALNAQQNVYQGDLTALEKSVRNNEESITGMEAKARDLRQQAEVAESRVAELRRQVRQSEEEADHKKVQQKQCEADLAQAKKDASRLDKELHARLRVLGLDRSGFETLTYQPVL